MKRGQRSHKLLLAFLQAHFQVLLAFHLTVEGEA